jgi:hypothetical protein
LSSESALLSTNSYVIPDVRASFESSSEYRHDTRTFVNYDVRFPQFSSFLLNLLPSFRDAVGATYLSPSAVDSYLIEGFKFALKSMPGNLGFLDILSLHVKKLSKTQAKTV